MTHDEDRRLAAWLGDSFEPAPVAALEEAFARARRTPQRPGWVVNLAGGTIAQGPADGRLSFSLVLAVVALLGLLAGALIAGGLLLPPKPAPSPLSIASGSPEPTASPAPTAQPKPRLVAFIQSGTLWVANLDGTEAHAVAADLGGCQGFPAWSPDGTRLLFSRIQCGFMTDVGDAGTRVYLTDASGSQPQVLDTGCVSPCLSDYGGVFSSDGGRILFVRRKSIPVPASATPDPVTGKPAQPTEMKVLASIDLATGRVTELGDFDACDRCGSGWPRSAPSWSPDRTQIVFTQDPGPAFFVADADGRNVHRLSRAGDFPGWSPDGTRIVFQGVVYRSVGGELRFFDDIYTIRPDGTDLRRLTTDQISGQPSWSVDGRIWFTRIPRVNGDARTEGPPQYWIMDPDGSHAARLSGPSPLQGRLLQPTP